MYMNLHFLHLLDFYKKTLPKRKTLVTNIFSRPWPPNYYTAAMSLAT